MPRPVQTVSRWLSPALVTGALVCGGVAVQAGDAPAPRTPAAEKPTPEAPAPQPAGATAPAEAGAPADMPSNGKKSVTQKILDRMRGSGQLDDETYKAWSQEAAEEAAASTKVDPEGWDFHWKDGFRLERNDGLFKLKFGGRIQLDFAGISESNGIQERFGGEGIGTEFRRTRLAFSGTVYKHVIFKAQYDFAGGSPDFKDVYVGLTKLPYAGTIRVGHFKEPFSLEEVTSSNNITLMERSLISVVNPVRNTGAMLNRTFTEDSRIWAGAGAFIVTDEFGDAFSNGRKYSVTARLTGLPLYDDGGSTLLHLGAGYNHRWVDGLQLAQRPEAHLAPKYLDTGAIAVSDVDAFNGEAAAVLGPFSLQTEITGVIEDRQEGSGVGFWGCYAEASYFFTGEHRRYDKKHGAFTSVKPLNNFSISKGHWGALQAAVRYSYLDLTDEDIQGGRTHDVSVGLNWYLTPNVRFMLNYVHAFIDSTTDQVALGTGSSSGGADIVQARFQVVF